MRDAQNTASRQKQVKQSGADLVGSLCGKTSERTEVVLNIGLNTSVPLLTLDLYAIIVRKCS